MRIHFSSTTKKQGTYDLILLSDGNFFLKTEEKQSHSKQPFREGKFLYENTTAIGQEY